MSQKGISNKKPEKEYFFDVPLMAIHTGGAIGACVTLAVVRALVAGGTHPPFNTLTLKAIPDVLAD